MILIHSETIYETIIKLIFACSCNKRRVVIRKGHIGYSLYFIFSGSVKIVLEKDEDKIHTSKPVAVLKKGACFGVRVHCEIVVLILIIIRRDIMFSTLSLTNLILNISTTGGFTFTRYIVFLLDIYVISDFVEKGLIINY